jgi:hypothetical protein
MVPIYTRHWLVVLVEGKSIGDCVGFGRCRVCLQVRYYGVLNIQRRGSPDVISEWADAATWNNSNVLLDMPR